MLNVITNLFLHQEMIAVHLKTSFVLLFFLFFFKMNSILCVEITSFLKSTLFEFEYYFDVLRVIYPDITTLGWIR